MLVETQRRSKLTLVSACGAHVVQDGLSAALYALMPVLAQAFGLSYAQIGMVRGIKAGAMAVFEMPSGLLSERFGERVLLFFGLLAAGGGYLLLGAVNGIIAIAASFAIIGTGTAFQHALSSALIATNSEPGRRRSALGIYNSSGDAGKLIFTGLFGLAMWAGFAWQGVVAAFGAIGLIFAGVLIIALKRAGSGAAKPLADNDNAAQTGGWGIKDPRGFTAIASAVFVDNAIQSGFMVFLAFLMIEKGASASIATFAMVAILVGGMFGKAGCGYLAERFGITTSFVITQVASAIGILLLLALPYVAAFVLLPILGIFLQGSTSITYGAVSDFVAPERQSRGFALIYSTSGVASILGPVAFGIVSDMAGLDMAMAAMAVLSVLGIVPVLGLRGGRSVGKS